MATPSWAPKRKQNEDSASYKKRYYHAQRQADEVEAGYGDKKAAAELDKIKSKLPQKQSAPKTGRDAEGPITRGFNNFTDAAVNAAIGIEGGGAAMGAGKAALGKLGSMFGKKVASTAGRAIGSAKMLTGKVPARGNPNTAKINRTKAYGRPKQLTDMNRQFEKDHPGYQAKMAEKAAASKSAPSSSKFKTTARASRTGMEHAPGQTPYRANTQTTGKTVKKNATIESTPVKAAPKAVAKAAPKSTTTIKKGAAADREMARGKSMQAAAAKKTVSRKKAAT